MTLTQYSYVVAVHTHGHFGRAAEACNVTQPTLSMQIRKLERTLGVTIFDRSRMPVVPTDLGMQIVEQARVVLREAARIPELRDEARGVVTGELRLGVIPTLAPYLLPRFLHELADRYPGLELVVEERITTDVIDGLRRETLDAGLIATPQEQVGLLEQVLFSEPFYAYVSPSHRLAGRDVIRTSDLSLDDLWLLSEGHCFRTQAVALCNARAGRGKRGHRGAGACTRVARFESGNLETLVRLVERGDGMTLLPALATTDLTGARRALLKPFVPPVPARDVRLVRRRAYLKRQLVDAVMETLLRALPPEVQRSSARTTSRRHPPPARVRERS